MSALLICREPTQPHWGLGRLPVPDAATLLVGLRTQPATTAGDVPNPAIQILARALTAHAWVTFPTTATTWPQGEGDPVVRTVRVTGPGGFLRAALGAAPTTITTASTRQAPVAAMLFDDGGFPWWLGAQTALLFDLAAPLPLPDHRTWLALLSDRWATATLSLSLTGLLGAIRAGVDGEVLGLVSTTSGFADALVDTVRRLSRDAGIECLTVTEDEVA